jgi:hypothetical protein
MCFNNGFHPEHPVCRWQSTAFEYLGWNLAHCKRGRIANLLWRYLVFVYSKNDAENLTPKKIKILRSLVEED